MTEEAGDEGTRPPEARAPATDLPPSTPKIRPMGEAEAERRLREAGDALIEGVGSALPSWAAGAADYLLTAWGGLDAAARRTAVGDAREAGEAAARRVAAELADLLALDAAEQRATPLEIIRTAVVEPTAVLAAAGLPDVVRDPFDERAWPDDRFGLVPRTLRDVDPDLAAVHFAWGIAKAALLRARAGAGPGTGEPPR